MMVGVSSCVTTLLAASSAAVRMGTGWMMIWPPAMVK